MYNAQLRTTRQTEATKCAGTEDAVATENEAGQFCQSSSSTRGRVERVGTGRGEFNCAPPDTVSVVARSLRTDDGGPLESANNENRSRQFESGQPPGFAPCRRVASAPTPT